MPQQKNYILLKEILDKVGQTEFLSTYGSLEDIYKIQMHFIYATCEYYDSKYRITHTDKKYKLKKE